MALQIQPVAAEQTHMLRHRVLRQHQRLEEMVYDGDDLPTTLHLGALAGESAHPCGIVTLVMLLQYLNAESSMLITVSGIVMLARPVQYANAMYPRLVTPTGIVMLVRLRHSRNA